MTAAELFVRCLEKRGGGIHLGSRPDRGASRMIVAVHHLRSRYPRNDRDVLQGFDFTA